MATDFDHWGGTLRGDAIEWLNGAEASALGRFARIRGVCTGEHFGGEAACFMLHGALRCGEGEVEHVCEVDRGRGVLVRCRSTGTNGKWYLWSMWADLCYIYADVLLCICEGQSARQA